MRKHHVPGIGVLRLSFVCALLVMAAFVPPAYAQHFGRNKVEYTDFDFRILATEHFDIYYYEREERAARIAAQLAERWYARISTVLNHQLERRQPLVIYGSQAEFAQTNVVSGLMPDSVGGVTESLRRRIVMPFAPTMAETNRVLGHELVHAFQFDIARRHGGGVGQPCGSSKAWPSISRAGRPMPSPGSGFATPCAPTACLANRVRRRGLSRPISTVMPSGRTSAAGSAMPSLRRR